MSSYCLKCRKNTESINPRVSRTNNGKTIIMIIIIITNNDIIKMCNMW